MFSCEFCEIPKNTIFAEHLWTAASIFMTYFLFAFSIIAWKLILSNKQIFDTRVLLAQTHLRKQVCVFIFLYQNILIKYFFKHLFSIRIFSWQETKKQLLKFQKKFKGISAKENIFIEIAGCLQFEDKVFSTTDIFRTSYS